MASSPGGWGLRFAFVASVLLIVQIGLVFVGLSSWAWWIVGWLLVVALGTAAAWGQRDAEAARRHFGERAGDRAGPTAWSAIALVLGFGLVLGVPLLEYQGLGLLEPEGPGAWELGESRHREGTLSAPRDQWSTGEVAAAGHEQLNMTLTWTDDPTDAATGGPTAGIAFRVGGSWQAPSPVEPGTRVLRVPEGATHWRLSVEGTQVQARQVTVDAHGATPP